MGAGAMCLFIIRLVLLLGQVSLLWAADKNGVSPNTISLPSGHGSIEGLGEAFQPQLNTGTARYGVNIAVPAGVAGHAPSLVLQYDSGYGDGPASLGWTYAPGAISRQTDKGIPRYVDASNGIDYDFDNIIDEADELDTFVGPDSQELVPFANNTYRESRNGVASRGRYVS